MQRLCLVFEKQKRRKRRKNHLKKCFTDFQVLMDHLGNLLKCRFLF